MKKILCMIVVLLLTVFFPINYTMAFDSPTHEYITQSALNILLQNFNEYRGFYNEDFCIIISEYSVKPDFDEASCAFKCHFYNPSNGKNFVGGYDSALSRFNMHYERAVKLFKSGKKEKAFEELGRSLHFLEDLNTPVHTNNKNILDAGKNFVSHVKFENICKEVQSNHCVKMSADEVLACAANSILDIGILSANKASTNFLKMKSGDKVEKVAGESIELAQRFVLVVLYKFANDVRV